VPRLSRAILSAINGSLHPQRHAVILACAVPGSAHLAMLLARTPAGVTLAVADCTLFLRPVTTSPSHFIMAIENRCWLRRRHRPCQAVSDGRIHHPGPA